MPEHQSPVVVDGVHVVLSVIGLPDVVVVHVQLYVVAAWAIPPEASAIAPNDIKTIFFIFTVLTPAQNAWIS